MRPSAKSLAAAFAMSVCSAAILQAGTVYIPLPGVQAVGNVNYEVRVAVTNPGTAQQSIKYLQIGTDTDGTKRSVDPTTQAVAAGRTTVFTANNVPGLLEISAPAGLEYSARLVGTGAAAGLGIELPVITSETAGAANEKLFVQGLRNSATRRTDVILVNLGKKATKCSAATRRADGTVLVNALSLPFAPLSHVKYSDVFADQALDDARVEVSCGAEFFAYAQLRDSSTGEFSVAGPTGGSDSALVAPGEEAPGSVCPAGTAGTTCFAYPGLIHTSTRQDPDHSVRPKVTPGNYSAVRARVEVQVNNWNLDTNSTGAHGVMYFVRNGNKEMWASIFLRPPGRDILGLRYGFFKNHGQKIAIDRHFRAELGATYVFEYLFDAANRVVELRVLQEGVEVLRIEDQPDVNRVIVDDNDAVILGLSNPGVSPKPEPYSKGWKYFNLLIEFIP